MNFDQAQAPSVIHVVFLKSYLYRIFVLASANIAGTKTKEKISLAWVLTITSMLSMVLVDGLITNTTFGFGIDFLSLDHNCMKLLGFVKSHLL